MSQATIGVTREELLEPFGKRLKMPGVSAAYRLGLALVAVVMVLLIVAYVGLIGLTGFGLYYHASHNTGMLANRLGVVGFIIPLVAGVILLLFLIKPLFAPKPGEWKPVSLKRKEEPLLFEFVERLCKTLGAPKPDRINVDVMINASAGLHLDMVSITSKGTVLTIGLPLLGGLTLRQLTGVLAHEFGHFRQGSGMRVSQLIRRVNGWFARVVYERDEWDERLIELSESDGWLSIFGVIARLFVWVSRKLLWLLMMFGHATSSLLMRQMEFDADRYEIVVAGSETFGKTAMRLRVLGTASEIVYGDLGEAWSEGRLGADLPALITHRARNLPNEIQTAIQRASLEEETGLFDTHPSDRERIDRARKARRPGLFLLEGPATALVHDFEKLSRRVTLAHYKAHLGDHVSAKNLVSNEAFLEHQNETEAQHEAAERYFQGLLNPDRMLGLGSARLAPPQPGGAERLAAARRDFDTRLRAAKGTYLKFSRGADLEVRARQAEHLLHANIEPDAEAFHLPSPDLAGIQRIRERAERFLDQSRPVLDDFEESLRERMLAALAVLADPALQPRVPGADAQVDLATRLLPVLDGLHRQLPCMVQLGEQHAIVGCLLQVLQHDPENDSLRESIRSYMQPMCLAIGGMQEELRHLDYPFPQAGERMTVGTYLVSYVPGHDDLQGLYETAEGLAQRYYSLYHRVLGRVGLVCEEVEKAFGMEPLPEPKQPTE